MLGAIYDCPIVLVSAPARRYMAGALVPSARTSSTWAHHLAEHAGAAARSTWAPRTLCALVSTTAKRKDAQMAVTTWAPRLDRCDAGRACYWRYAELNRNPCRAVNNQCTNPLRPNGKKSSQASCQMLADCANRGDLIKPRRDGAEPLGANMERPKTTRPKEHLFEPCRATAKPRPHESCAGAFRDEDGLSVRCTCKCHHQADLFRVVISVQRNLFE